ncbi:MAG: glycoside hydrolase family 5 protein [Clostridia bacterium]|nr:glycoside hydrolase family 5 protein [Clostridia bacterium]
MMDFRDLSAQELLAGMGAGWNLGNTLDAICSRLGTPAQCEMAWGNPVTTPEMVKLLADTGFSTFRIPVTWEAHIGPAPEYKIDEPWMDRVQEVVDYGIDNGLYVILNLHHEDWHFPSYDNYESVEGKLIAVWTQIAGRFGGYSEKLLFETMNEPRMKGTPQEWSGGTAEARDVLNRWNAAIVAAVRDTEGHNAQRYILVPTIAASADEVALRGFVLPEDDRVIVSVHAYTPYNFALNTKAPDNIFTSSVAREIDALFRRLDRFFLSKGIPVVMGECGSVEKGNLESRVEWAAHYAGKAAEHGVPVIWWDNGIQITPANNEGFGVMDRRNVTWWYPEIVEAFIAPYR